MASSQAIPERQRTRSLRAKGIRVAIEARLVSGQGGGVESVLIGLAHGLSNLRDGEEDYLFLTWSDEKDWLQPYVHGACRLWEMSPRPTNKEWLRKNLPIVARWARGRLNKRGRMVANGLRNSASGFEEARARPWWSDARIESSGVDLIHFPIQTGFLTALPTIYHPHDLQHLHFPEYFSPRERLAREVLLNTLCSDASLVAVASSWVKRDVVEHLGIESEKVEVVPLAPVLGVYPEATPDALNRVRGEHQLPEAFILYPAQTWAHKNHIALLEALALLRDEQGVRVPLVCTGRLTDFFATIEQRMRELRLEDQVRFLGFVSPLDLQCLYRLTRATVIPTKFEAASNPLWEAFTAGSPAACSTVTSLPEQAGDAALLFDAGSPRAIADAVRQLWMDAELRRELVRRGRASVGRFSWERTARLFRAHYRRIAGNTLSSEDRELLAAPPLL